MSSASRSSPRIPRSIRAPIRLSACKRAGCERGSSEYYREEGQGDEIAIDLPKGGYSPVFRRKESTASGKPSLSATLAGRNTVFGTPVRRSQPGS